MSASPEDSSWRPVQRYSIVTPLGIRFWDPATDTQVADGLKVIAYPDGARRPATTGLCTVSGVYAFHGLPGLRAVEDPQGDAASVGSLPPAARFRIEVTDTEDRFLPMAFSVDAPFRGIYPADLPGFFLFSAPTRSSTPFVAAVRAQLSVIGSATVPDRPAAHAVLEIQTPNG